ncbi:MAG: DnaJ C-terminal domain-containing protein [Desulfomonilaceae bacterium]
MSHIDPYKVLGVNKGASDDEIKRAFRRLARKHHPDVNSNSKASERKFKEVSEAYEILSDKQRRRNYDMFGNADPGNAFGGFNNFRKGPGFGTRGFGTNPFGSEYSSGYGARAPYEDLFSSFFSRGNDNSGFEKGPVKGKDIEHSVRISFYQAYEGSRVSIDTPQKKIEVQIPPGVDNGSRIRVAGQGALGIRGGRPGDLYLKITVEEHELFRRQENDIHLELPVTLGEAMLGALIEIPSPDGRLALRIPPGSGQTRKFRFKGKGFASLKDSSRGDFFVKLKLILPKDIDEYTKDLVSEFERLNPLDVRSNF